MHFKPLALLSLLASSAAAATLKIEVGSGGQLVFSPNTHSAAIGDILEFHYYPKNHSVVQASFSAPCVPLAGGFFSGFVPVTSGDGPSVFRVTVNDTKPIWYYCAQTAKGHCQAGMVGAINAPTSGNTFAAFQAAAEKTTLSTSPLVVEGGAFAPNGNSTSAGAATTSAATSAATSRTTTGPAASITLTVSHSSSATSASAAASATPTKSEGVTTSKVRLVHVVGLLSFIGGVALFA